MIIRHRLPNNGFVKLDRKVISDNTLSDGAARLYTYLCSLPNGANYSDKYLVKALDISQRTLLTRKKELKERNLIFVDQIGKKVYVIYIGHSKINAQQVRDLWMKEEDSNGE